MTVTIAISEGADIDFAWRQSAEGDGAERYRGAGYYAMGPKTWEPPGIWWGAGAAAIGLQPGTVIDYADYAELFLFHRAPDGSSLAPEPELPYLDVTVTIAKSASILHASLGINLVNAIQPGSTEDAQQLMSKIDDFDAAIMRASDAALNSFQRHVTVVGDSHHMPAWFPADLLAASWLHHSSAAGNPHLHVHNQLATIGRARADGQWRPLDREGLVEVWPGAQAVASLTLRNALTHRLGVDWVHRPDGKGREIMGVSQALIDALSP